jgi:hypothetical protein
MLVDSSIGSLYGNLRNSPYLLARGLADDKVQKRTRFARLLCRSSSSGTRNRFAWSSYSLEPHVESLDQAWARYELCVGRGIRSLVVRRTKAIL